MASLNVVNYVNKQDSLLMWLLGWFVGRETFPHRWTTLRIPFGPSTIYYPVQVSDPFDPLWDATREHEMVHVAQQATAWGLLKTYLLYVLLPLPVLLSGRWFIEREAYLINLRHGMTPAAAAGAIWSGYFYPWPRSWMRRWFEAQSKEKF